MRLIGMLVSNMRARAVAAARVRAGVLLKLNGRMSYVKPAVQALAQIHHHVRLGLRVRLLQNNVRAECNVLRAQVPDV